MDVRSYRFAWMHCPADEATYFLEEFYPALHVKNKLCRIYLRLRQPADSFLRNPKSLALLGIQKRRPTDLWELSKCTGCYFVGGLANSEHQVQHPYKPVRRCPPESGLPSLGRPAARATKPSLTSQISIQAGMELV